MRTVRRHISLLNPARVPSTQEPGGYSPTPDGRDRLDLSERSVHKSGRGGGGSTEWRRRGGNRTVFLTVAAIVLIVFAAGAIALVTMKASLSESSTGLATVGMPLGGGTIERVSAVHGPHSEPIPVTLRGHEVWPRGHLRAGEVVEVDAVVKRPGWASWLTGGTERVRITLRTPTAALRQQFLTLPPHAPLRVHYDAPVAAVSYGPVTGRLRVHRLATPQSEVTLPRAGAAGSLFVAAVPRTWETTQPTAVSYFPPGATAAAVASPQPGSQVDSGTPIALTFSAPVTKVLHGDEPVITPHTDGSWQTSGTHTIVFHPSGYGYGLGTNVTIALPGGVRLVGAQGGNASTAGWNVPAGSTLRLQQLLAELNYLPLKFHEHGGQVAANPQAQEAAAVSPPGGTFVWRYGNVPSALHGFWAPGTAGVMTRGAVMAFENEQGMSADGEAGPAVWRALLAASIAHKSNGFGYTFVTVNKGSQELTLWHNGRTVMSTPVNTGIASRPTEAGTFPVYEHVESGTMSGTNPDGSHYEDPGVPWISYFNGGDALHGFERAQYGFPQSLGCVEMPPSTAGKVWPYTPIGTLVHVEE